MAAQLSSSAVGKSVPFSHCYVQVEMVTLTCYHFSYNWLWGSHEARKPLGIQSLEAH